MIGIYLADHPGLHLFFHQTILRISCNSGIITFDYHNQMHRTPDTTESTRNEHDDNEGTSGS